VFIAPLYLGITDSNLDKKISFFEVVEQTTS
jgi:hypothetical protein